MVVSQGEDGHRSKQATSGSVDCDAHVRGTADMHSVTVGQVPWARRRRQV